MSISRKQHFLPKTYLKYFAIAPNIEALRSLVYCGWKDDYGRIMIQEKSINSTFFKRIDFYTTFQGEDLYKYEDFFRREIEPLYFKIMKEIEAEQNLSRECRENLLIFLFFNKYRNLANRENFERIAQNMYSVQRGKKLPKIVVEKYATKMHMEFMFKYNSLAHFIDGMGIKKAEILKSNPSFQFISSDNPGFSFDNYPKLDIKSLNFSYATKWEAVNIFILSPKYCLIFYPLGDETPYEVNFFTQEISYENAETDMIHFVNVCTNGLKNKYLISNDRLLLEKYLTVKV